MGLIINKRIPMLMKGYPTVSDKYNVAGATLVGTDPVYFGDLVKFSSQKGFFEAIGTGVADVTEIAGFVLATNVKLASDDNVTVPTKPGESFNLALGGNTYMAIGLDADADEDDIGPNKTVQVILATGKCTTAAVTTGIVTLPGVVFTGTYEKHGEEIFAEILIK